MTPLISTPQRLIGAAGGAVLGRNVEEPQNALKATNMPEYLTSGHIDSEKQIYLTA